MNSPTVGEQVYAELVASGRRSQILYADARILKRLHTEAELRHHCELISGQVFGPEATPLEMVSACVKREPDRSDVELLGHVFTSGAPEGCLFLIPIAAFIMTGLPIGAMVRFLGMDPQRFVSRFAVELRIAVYTILAITVMTAIVIRDERAYWPAMIPGFIGGMLFARKERSFHDNMAAFVGSLTGIWIWVSSFFMLAAPSFLPAVAATVLCGTGYGINRSLEDLFEKRKGQPLANGMISMRLPENRQRL